MEKIKKIIAYCKSCGASQGTFNNVGELRLKIAEYKKCESCGSLFSFLSDRTIWDVGWEEIETTEKNVVDKGDKLDFINGEIKLDIKNIRFKDNLFISVNEIEQGHFLPSCLITARVVDYVLDKIPPKDESKENDINNKIDYLVEIGAINKEKNQEKEETKAFIIKASKKARNIHTHTLETGVGPSDASSLLGDCVRIIKLVEKANINL